MKIRHLLAALTCAALFPTMAMAQDEADDWGNDTPIESYDYQNAKEDLALSDGFSLILNIGPTLGIYEELSTGYHKFDAHTAGALVNLDLGVKMGYFGIYGDISVRAAFSIADELKGHCPGEHAGDLATYCYDYKMIREGEPDGYYAGLGLKLLGFIPINDHFLITAGGTPMVYFGRAIGTDKGETTFVLKIEVGFQFKVSEKFLAGFTITEEGFLDKFRAISPAFTLIYNY